ncbi:MAG: hypothetical protein ABJJ48_07130, partial [Marinomonas sp.]
MTATRFARTALSATLAFALVACGGGGSSTPITSGGSSGGSSGGGQGTSGACSLSERQDWALDVVNEWYLFPDLLASNVNKASHSDLQSYLNALVAPARAENKDRGFTFITSIEEENALINSGSSAGFGIRLAYDTSANRVFILESFETAPGFQAGMDRGSELLAIGSNSSN